MQIWIGMVLLIGLCRAVCHYCLDTSYDLMGLKSHKTYIKYTTKVPNAPELCIIHLDVLLYYDNKYISKKLNIGLL